MDYLRSIRLSWRGSFIYKRQGVGEKQGIGYRFEV